MRKYHKLYTSIFIHIWGIKDNLTLKNTHANQRCFIIGNGPSVKIQDLSKLRNEWTFVTNGFYLHEKYDDLHPKFYVVIDPKHFKGDEDSINFMNNLGKKIHEDTVVFFPFQSKEFIEKNNFLSKNKKYYLYMRGNFEEHKPNNTDINKAIPGLQSVSVGCVVIAKYLGFDPIYLMGLEHNWLAIKPTADSSHLHSSHFYDVSKQYLTDNNFYPYEYSCWCQYNLYRSYRLIKKEASTQIINLTPDSYLDVFPFAKYEDILKKNA